MRIVIIGGTGLIGSRVANRLREEGHEVVAASPSSGVNTITGEGLKQALVGAQVVIDVANAPNFEDKAVLEFFETSSKNLLAAEHTAGVKHHLTLSVVGTERLFDSGYLRAKLAQERLVRFSGIPFTIVHSTQFFEFLGGIAEAGSDTSVVRISPAQFQPIAANDVVEAIAAVAVGAPVNGTVEIAGPEPMRLVDAVRRFLQAKKDPRTVVEDINARYFGALLNDQSLLPGANPHIGATRLDVWLDRQQAAV